MDKMPRYRIAFRFVDSEEPILEGREEILYINQEQAGLKELVLRLYPNYLFLVGGCDHHMEVGDVRVNSEPADFKYIISNTGILIRLPQTLLQNETVQIEMSFAMLLEPYAQGIWKVPHSYLLLAVRDENGWRTDLPTNGDLVYSESGLHVIDLMVPKRMNIAATGTETNRKDLGEDMRIYTFTAPGMRDFTFFLGEELQRAQTTVDGTTIYLWHVSDDPLVNDKLEIVADAVSFFDNTFGSYPYADMDIVTRYDPEWWGPGGSGMEYPGLSTYTHHTENWQWNLVHEVVHQWWFGVVGNDVLMEPWLDEALAEYSTYLYFREAYDEEYASEVFYENVLKDYIEIGKEYGRVSGGEPVGLSVYDFPTFDAMYSWIVYGKGALFLDKLREELGHNVFLRFLQEYYRQHKYQVATGESFKETAEQVSGVDLDELFDRWVWK
ncbi:MAG: hypothetical protein GTO18_20165 [Anaerolineales bacterium]|nr:hypothetical protein [Anaerolineales bacterium]